MSSKMNYKIIPLKPFEKFYTKRSAAEKATIDAKLDILKANPFDNHLDIKKLQGYERRYRLRIWDYRIFYEIYNDKLIIVVITGENRGDAYK